MFPLMVDSAWGQDVFWHSFYVAGVDSPQVGVFNKPHQRGLFCLLQSTQGCTLKAQICFEDQRNFSHQALKEEPVDWVCGVLTKPHFSQCYPPGLWLCLFTPPIEGALLHADFVANCFLDVCMSQDISDPLIYPLLWAAVQRTKGSSGMVVRNTVQSHHCLVLSESLALSILPSPGLK